MTDGSVDRDKLRSRRPGEQINEFIRHSIWERVEQAAKDSTDPIVFSSARVLEERFPVDFLVVVSCDSQRERAIARGVPEHIVDTIMGGQFSLTALKQHANMVIDNNGAKEDLKTGVAMLMEAIKNKEIA